MPFFLIWHVCGDYLGRNVHKSLFAEEPSFRGSRVRGTARHARPLVRRNEWPLICSLQSGTRAKLFWPGERAPENPKKQKFTPKSSIPLPFRSPGAFSIPRRRERGRAPAVPHPTHRPTEQPRQQHTPFSPGTSATAQVPFGPGCATAGTWLDRPCATETAASQFPIHIPILFPFQHTAPPPTFSCYHFLCCSVLLHPQVYAFFPHPLWLHYYSFCLLFFNIPLSLLPSSIQYQLFSLHELRLVTNHTTKP